jgi:hypothetical protein
MMKKSTINSLSVYLCGILVSLWLVTPMMAVTPGEEPGSIVQWMNSLPEKTQALVMEVLDKNIACVEITGVNGEQIVSPVAQMSERIYRDLQIVLTEEQLAGFYRLSKGSAKIPGMDEISVTRSTCSDCYDIYNRSLKKVVDYLDEAEVRYDPVTYNCEQPPWGMPDPIATMINAAQIYAQNARSKTWTAYSSCSCTSAQGALSDAQKALGYLNSAISGTVADCDPDAPWLEWLEAAKDWLEYAIDNFPDCISQACS